ncbi:MAG: 3-oxoacyl-ACP synthase, partial [Bacteroidaceae bacterium]|nr:3-oxoacyl-ACP synthase [Bacteroidaceae bacterium]
YNDQMESKAISEAGLSDVPTNALKGYLGHTMGAAGVVESILTMHALDEGLILATRGYEEIGVSGRLTMSGHSLSTDKHDFLKVVSGFGGCNGAVYFSREQHARPVVPTPYSITHRVTIRPDRVTVDGNPIHVEAVGADLLTALYKQLRCGYPKYYKMDSLARLGFIATELLRRAEGDTTSGDASERAVVFFNRTGSYIADKAYLATIADAADYYPSPSLFVYTLPNIVTGEVAIRQQCHGETAFYILPERDEQTMGQIVRTTTCDTSIRSIIAGWVDYPDDAHFEADIYIAQIK